MNYHIEQKQTGSQQDCDTTLHKKCAICVHQNGANSNIEKIIAIWSEPPEHIKAAIKALIQSHIEGAQK